MGDVHCLRECKWLQIKWQQHQHKHTLHKFALIYNNLWRCGLNTFGAALECANVASLLERTANKNSFKSSSPLTYSYTYIYSNKLVQEQERYRIYVNSYLIFMWLKGMHNVCCHLNWITNICIIFRSWWAVWAKSRLFSCIWTEQYDHVLPYVTFFFFSKLI